MSRTLHEYQFIPEQPTVRNEKYEGVTPSIHYSSLDGVPQSRTSLSSGQSFLNGNESAPNEYGVQGQIPGLNLLSQQGRQDHLLPSASGGNDDVPQKNPFVDATVDTHRGAHPITLIDGPLVPSGRQVIHEEELSRFQRKRKVSLAHNPNMFLSLLNGFSLTCLVCRMKRLECNGNLKHKRKELEKSLQNRIF